jgi:uncharacterized iron-regulated protein
MFACLSVMGAVLIGGASGCSASGGRSASMSELWAMRTGERLEAGGLGSERGFGSGGGAAQDVRDLEMFDGQSGERVAWRELVEMAAGADVVVIGEMHGHSVGLEAAAELFEDVVAMGGTGGGRAALSMEFFDRDRQAAIDDYLMGVTDEEAFKKAAGRTDGNYPAGHRRMVELARRSGMDVIASNAPRRYVRYGRREGRGALSGFTSEQARLVDVPIDVTMGAYRGTFLEMFGFNTDGTAIKSEEEEGDGEDGGGHGSKMTFEDAEGYFFAQNIWDETMARSIDDALRRGAGPVVHVVGRFHSDFDGGLVERVRMMSPSARVVVLSMVDEQAEGGAIREDDLGRAEIVLYVGTD